jgi:hypothetical protein
MAAVVPALLTLVLPMLLSWDPPGDTPAWREKQYSGRSEYRLVGHGDDAVLHAVANGRNSAWLTDLHTAPDSLRLHWRWRVLQHPFGANPDVRSRDDRAAGVLVIVRKSIFPWRVRALLYHWVPYVDLETWSTSPYSGNVKTLVVENAAADSVWRVVDRDLAADLKAAFGEVPKRIEAIGVICDADDTRERAEAEFGPIRLVPR